MMSREELTEFRRETVRELAQVMGKEIDENMEPMEAWIRLVGPHSPTEFLREGEALALRHLAELDIVRQYAERDPETKEPVEQAIKKEMSRLAAVHEVLAARGEKPEGVYITGEGSGEQDG